jgi:hypothetical protein
LSGQIDNTSIKGDGYDSLSDVDKELRIRGSIRAIATSARNNGSFRNLLSENANVFTAQEWTWLCSELSLYKSTGMVSTNFSAMTGMIRNSGLWTALPNGYYIRDFSNGTNNLGLLSGSPLLQQGLQITNRVTDILGNVVGTSPDIGAYQN